MMLKICSVFVQRNYTVNNFQCFQLLLLFYMIFLITSCARI